MLEGGGGASLRFGVCNGFRNIQNVVRAMKLKRGGFHFLEVMACPAGCVNGGGQAPPPPGASAKQALERVVEIFKTAQTFRPPSSSGAVQLLCGATRPTA